jgi:hypothetical protein
LTHKPLHEIDKQSPGELSKITAIAKLMLKEIKRNTYKKKYLLNFRYKIGKGNEKNN